MKEENRGYLQQEAARAETALARAGTALAEGREEDFAQALSEGILHRFLLFDLPDASALGLDELCERSIEQVLSLTGGDFAAAGVIMGCGGATTGLYKKIELLFDLQKRFAVKFDPARTPDLETMAQLAAEVIYRRKAMAAPSVAVSEDEPPGRADFPLLCGKEAGIYLDCAATMPVPIPVLEAQRRCFESGYANVHRGSYPLARKATAAYEAARQRVAAFLGAEKEEIIFTFGATAGLNLLARAWEERLSPGARVLVTVMEHHANFLPWQELCRRKGCTLEVLPVNARGDLDLSALEELLAPPTALLAFCHSSNVLGTVNPVADICRRARARGVVTVVDGAQGIRHERVDVKAMACDFYVFSGHKLMTGGGIGVLYGRRELLEHLPPPFVGGGMVALLENGLPHYEPLPQRWEAGTPHLAGALSLSAVLDYWDARGVEQLREREERLLKQLCCGLGEMDSVELLGAPVRRAGCVAFRLRGMSTQDTAAALGLRGIAVRAGHHCAIPLHESFGWSSSLRVSPAFFNSFGEIDMLLEELRQLVRYKN